MATPWGRRARQYGRRARLAAWHRGQRLQRVVSQAPEAARKAGRSLARHVVSIQRSAGLEARPKTRELMERSFWATVGEHRGTDPSPDWQQGYGEQALALMPGLNAVRVDPAAEPEPPPEPPRPSWPRMEPDEPEAGS